MLHDRQSQARTSSFFGMALVHPVEPLEDTLVMLLWDTDAGVSDADPWTVQRIARPDGHPAAIVVIFDRILTYIVDHLIQDLADAGIFHWFSGHLHPDILLGCLGREPAYDLPCQIIEIDLLFLKLHRLLIQFGQFYYVLYQGDEPSRFFLNTLREHWNVRRSHHPILHDLRIAGD